MRASRRLGPGVTTERGTGKRVSRRPEPPGRRSGTALIWLLCQVLLALCAREVRRPIQRPAGAELLLWPAMIAVATSFLILLAQWSGLLAVAIAVALLFVTWRGWH